MMKMTTLLAVISVLQLSAAVYSQDTEVSLDIRKGNFADIITAIEEQSEFKVFFKNDQIDLERPVSLQAKNRPVSEVLNQALEGTGIRYTLLDKIIVLSPENENLIEQGITITGKVVSGTDEQPLPGVNVIEKGTNNGAVTDIDGNYRITVGSEDATLVFSYVGYLTEEIALNGRTQIDVSLAEDIQSLDEVVVIGYGSRQKKDVTTAVSTVSSNDLEKTTAISPDLAMQGRMSGVFVQSNGASPFERPTVRVRVQIPGVFPIRSL